MLSASLKDDFSDKETKRLWAAAGKWSDMIELLKNVCEYINISAFSKLTVAALIWYKALVLNKSVKSTDMLQHTEQWNNKH